jgi:hypothetical protein
MGERDARGGARKRGEQRALRRFLPDADPPLYRYDLSCREDGPGAAGADADAIAEWLSGRLVVRDGERWLVEGEVEREIEDYEPAMKRGRKSKEVTRLYIDLVDRVEELVEAGAYQRSIAEVLGVNEKTVGGWLDLAKRRKHR